MSTRDFLTSDEWAQAVKSYLGTSEFDVLTIKLRHLNEGDVGYLGVYRLAELAVQLRDSELSQCVLRFFIKVDNEDVPYQKEIIAQTGAFRKEVEALSSIFADFRSVLENDGEGMEWTCRCFYTRPDIIVLEDLKAMGFRLMSNNSETAFQDCALALEALANMHAASLIYEEKQLVQPYRLGTERSKALSSGFVQNLPGHPGYGWLKAGTKSALWLLEEIHGKETLRSRSSQVEEVMNDLFDLMQPSERFRNVLCHADTWKNNIFLRTEEGKRKQALFVDFQQVIYAPPALDVMWFLHVNTTRAFRAQNASRLLTLYHKHLSQNLQSHGLASEQILHWEEFEESCGFYRKAGVIVSLCTVGMFKQEEISHVFTSSEEYERFLTYDRTPEVKNCFLTDGAFREKFTQIIDELIEICDVNRICSS